jgi:hypothetical protein
MLTQEEVDEFFLEFAREMREQGLFIMDSFVEFWPNLPTKDEVRQVEDELSDELSVYDYL